MKDASLGFTNPGILSKTINSLDELYKDDIKSLDMQGDLYEYMLSKLSVAGQNGQFRTPKQIRDMMVQLRKPSPDDMIVIRLAVQQDFLFRQQNILESIILI